MFKKGEKRDKNFKKHKKELSAKDLELKEYKKEFRMQQFFFKSMKKIGSSAVKEYKVAKKLLKKGDIKACKEKVGKYVLFDINFYTKLLKK